MIIVHKVTRTFNTSEDGRGPSSTTSVLFTTKNVADSYVTQESGKPSVNSRGDSFQVTEEQVFDNVPELVEYHNGQLASSAAAKLSQAELSAIAKEVLAGNTLMPRRSY